LFTGIVEEVGEVRAVEHRAAGSWLRLAAPAIAATLRLGDSVAVDGACLTAVAIDDDEVAFEAMGETLARTTLGRLAPGDRVNLEGAVRAGDPLGGHVVQGHVDGVGEIVGARSEDIARVLALRVDGALLPQLVTKGSVAVAGVSLTVAALTDDGFEVWLIPHTLAVTTLGSLAPGDAVNVETDILGKYVERLVGARASGGETSRESPSPRPDGILAPGTMAARIRSSRSS
jgi:riboflavin synthase